MISASVESAVDVAAPSTAASSTSIVAGIGQPVMMTADAAAVEQANVILPPRPVMTATPGSVPESAGVPYRPGMSLDNQWSAAQNDSAAAAGTFNNSYFGAHQVASLPSFGPRPQRPLHDIVSSMQGSFHFLQESQIELESMYQLYSICCLLLLLFCFARALIFYADTILH